jgi:hypothetical protein
LAPYLSRIHRSDLLDVKLKPPTPVASHHLVRPPRLHNVTPWQKLCHDRLDVKHRRAIDGIEPGDVKLNAFHSE